MKLEQDGLNSQLNFRITAADLESLAKMEQASNIQRLSKIGRLCGQGLVDPEHFLAAFNLSKKVRIYNGCLT